MASERQASKGSLSRMKDAARALGYCDGEGEAGSRLRKEEKAVVVVLAGG
jgi:hypothetical protein